MRAMTIQEIQKRVDEIARFTKAASGAHASEVAVEMEDKRSSARWERDSLCPAGAALVSTMPAPSGFLDGAGCEKIVGS